MVHYLHAVAAYNEAKPLQNGPLLTGWCSWYHYYENISADKLRTNFAKLASMKNKVPTNVAVVDDGYMTAWGDWDSFKPQQFTDMTVVCRDIVSHGMRPGLWLAPFTCDKHSTIVKQHPEWIIRNDRGRPANSSNCGKFFYGLDATNPKVRAHAFEAVRRAVHDWGFQVLKIDFLYAACLEGNGKYDLSMTRAQAMHLALQTIRDAAGPDIFLIGCGCPIGTGIGYVDGMRISADTGPTWYPALPLPWWDHGTLPALRAMIRNSLTRAPMGHRWWHNDPDCLLLGETTSLTDEEVASAASIVAMTCGMMLLSDDLTKVSIARMRILTKIFPMTGVTAVVLDLHTAKDMGMPTILRLWCTDKYNSVLEEYRQESSSNDKDQSNVEATYFGRQASFNVDQPLPHPNERKRSCIHVAKGLGTWTVVSLSNWGDRSQVLHIPRIAVESPPETGWTSSDREDVTNKDENRCGYHIFSFWSCRYSWMSSSKDDPYSTVALSRRLGAHETEIFHVRPVTPGVPQYVGSDLHFSCGHEVLTFTTHQNKVSIQLKTDLNRVGHVYLFVPTVDTSHVRVVVAGQPGRWSVVGNTPETVDGRPAHCCGRILRVMVVVHGNGSDQDGAIAVDY
jgi:alpha-galactosidase